MTDDRRLTIGFPRMYNEPGERRAFLPPLIGLLADMDVDVYVEAGSGAGMGYSDDDYLAVSPRVHIVDEATAYRQDIVVVLRAPEGRYELLRPGAILLSMLHFTTRPERVELLRGLGIEAIALDMVTGDDGRRLVQNLRDVARNGLAAAFDALERRWPPLLSPDAPAGQRHDPGRRRGRQARHRVGRQVRRRGAQRAVHARGPARGRGRGGRAEPVGQRGLLPAPPGADRHPRRRHGATRHVASPVPQCLARLAARPRDRLRPGGRSLPARRRPAGRARDRGHPPGQPGPVGVRPGRPGLGPPAARDPDRATGERSSPATRGRASSPRPAWRPTARR